MSRKATIFLAIMLVGFLSMFIVGKALASGTWYYYDLTVEPFGGSTPTNNQQKLYSGQCAVDCDWVGGDYDLWAYLQLSDNTTVSDKQLINDGTFIRFDNTASAGQYVHMMFESGWSDHVHIETVGHWSPDTP
jgi:hypothetical protein